VLTEPGVFGIFRPVLILPAGIAGRLSKAEWETILAHEICHVGCHDNLTAAIYMVGRVALLVFIRWCGGLEHGWLPSESARATKKFCGWRRAPKYTLKAF